jgi:hypothetical protein
MGPRWPLLTIPYLFLGFFTYIPLSFLLIYLIFFLTSPYTLYYYTANRSLLKRDMPAIQVYLNHFQRLYPELTSALAAAKFRLPALTIAQPRATLFWPSERSSGDVAGMRVRQYNLTEAAVLFVQLEYAGWSRRMLLTFLRDKVEQGVGREITREEREAFGRVMKKLCDHDLTSWLMSKFSDAVSFFESWTYPRLKNWEEVDGVPRPIVRMDYDSVEWVLRGGAFVVPGSIRVRMMMKLTTKNFPLWQVVRNAVDLETGLGDYWQMMATK